MSARERRSAEVFYRHIHPLYSGDVHEERFVPRLAVPRRRFALTQAQRKIPVQYAKRVVGQRVYGGQSSFLPLKINYSGVMPVIFAKTLLGQRWRH